MRHIRPQHSPYFVIASAVGARQSVRSICYCECRGRHPRRPANRRGNPSSLSVIADVGAGVLDGPQIGVATRSPLSLRTSPHTGVATRSPLSLRTSPQTGVATRSPLSLRTSPQTGVAISIAERRNLSSSMGNYTYNKTGITHESCIALTKYRLLAIIKIKQVEVHPKTENRPLSCVF